LGGSKKEPEKPPTIGKGFIPTDKAKDLSSKGFSEPEIIDILRKEGFSSEEIDRALTQTLKLGVMGEENAEMPTIETLNKEQNPPFFQDVQTQVPALQQFEQQQNVQPTQQEYYQPQEYISEEIIESIVHEKMVDLDERLVEFKNKYNDLERKILDLHNKLSLVSKDNKEKESEILSKMESLKESVEDMSAKLSSLEKTFKEALPSLI